MKQLTEKEIAVAILDLYNKHEQSWDEELGVYTAPKLWSGMVEPFLGKHTEYSGFALVLLTFGWQYRNDVKSLCEQIERGEQYTK
jgi:hypothetical protein